MADPQKEQTGIFRQIASSLGGIASAIQQVASFIRAQTLSHTHTGGTDGQQLTIAANAAIAMTKLANFTDWTAWTPSYTGFSVNPTATAMYMQIGKLVIAYYLTTAGGTSNSAAFTTTLPAAANKVMQYPTGAIGDNTAVVSVAGRLDTAANSTTLTAYKDMGGTGWTTSGTKNVN